MQYFVRMNKITGSSIVSNEVVLIGFIFERHSLNRNPKLNAASMNLIHI